jgi:hypothetical protein
MNNITDIINESYIGVILGLMMWIVNVCIMIKIDYTNPYYIPIYCILMATIIMNTTVLVIHNINSYDYYEDVETKSELLIILYIIFMIIIMNISLAMLIKTNSRFWKFCCVILWLSPLIIIKQVLDIMHIMNNIIDDYQQSIILLNSIIFTLTFSFFVPFIYFSRCNNILTVHFYTSVLLFYWGPCIGLTTGALLYVDQFGSYTSINSIVVGSVIGIILAVFMFVLYMIILVSYYWFNINELF